MREHKIFRQNRRLALICFSSSNGGLELTTLRLARELHQRESECLIVCPPNTPLAAYALRENIPAEFLSPRMKYGDLFAALRLLKILKSHHIDVVVVVQSRDIHLAVLAKLFYPHLKIVYYQQMQSVVDKRDAIHTWIYSKLSAWVTLTEKMKSEVIAHTRTPEQIVQVAPLGTEMTRFNPEQYDAAMARKKFELPVNGIVVGMLGRLDPQKGQETFLRAIPSILKKHPNASFVIAGEETRGEEGYKRYLTQLRDDLQLHRNVYFLPFTDDVPEFMSALDIFILPSRSETYGLVLIEAMAMRKAVVATTAGGVPEIVTNERDGLLVPPDNANALAEAILMLLDNARLREVFGNQARVHALKKFDASHCIDKLVGVLEEL